MVNRNLKNYQIYLDRILLFALAMGISVEYGSLDAEGLWMPASAKIKIDEDLSQTGELATLLHELGHSLDDMFVSIVPLETRLCKAYTAVYSNKASAEQIKIVLKCEQRAWDNGRNIAQRLKVKLGRWYADNEIEAMETYRKNR